jgi:hypothetical protein
MPKKFNSGRDLVLVLGGLALAAAALAALAWLARPAAPALPTSDVSAKSQPGPVQASAPPTEVLWQFRVSWSVSAAQGASVELSARPSFSGHCEGPVLPLAQRRGTALFWSEQGLHGAVEFCLPSTQRVTELGVPDKPWRSLSGDQQVSLEWDARALRLASPHRTYVLRAVAGVGCADDLSGCSGAAALELFPEGARGEPRPLSLPAAGFSGHPFDVVVQGLPLREAFAEAAAQAYEELEPDGPAPETEGAGEGPP